MRFQINDLDALYIVHFCLLQYMICITINVYRCNCEAFEVLGRLYRQCQGCGHID